MYLRRFLKRKHQTEMIESSSSLAGAKTEWDMSYTAVQSSLIFPLLCSRILSGARHPFTNVLMLYSNSA